MWLSACRASCSRCTWSRSGTSRIQQIGLLGSISTLSMMFIPMLSGKLVDRYSERVPLVAGFLMIFGAFMVFLQAESFLVFALSWIIFGIGGGLLGPAYQSLISKVVPAKMLGTFSGVFDSSRGIISLPAPWLGAQLWERFSPQTPFLISALGLAGDPAADLAQVPRAQGGASRGGAGGHRSHRAGGGGKAAVICVILRKRNVGAGLRPAPDIIFGSQCCTPWRAVCSRHPARMGVVWSGTT